MRKTRLEYGKYTADVFINNQKVTIQVDRAGRADSSIQDAPLTLLEDVSRFILDNQSPSALENKVGFE